MRWWGLLVTAPVVGVALAGCGGGASSVAATPATKATTRAASSAPTPSATATVTGRDAITDLRDFRCLKSAAGTWNASGAVSNDGKTATSYQVTVLVASGTTESKARTYRIASVQAGGSATFKLTKLPAPKTGGTCHVQVLAVG